MLMLDQEKKCGKYACKDKKSHIFIGISKLFYVCYSVYLMDQCFIVDVGHESQVNVLADLLMEVKFTRAVKGSNTQQGGVMMRP